MPALTGHPVLVATPLHASALDRLRAFFVVQEADASADRLAGMAGVVADEDVVFDASLIERLPTLQAVSVAGQRQDQLDLPALTRAGVRATNTPLDDDALLVEALWRELERSLRLASPGAAPTMRPTLRPGARLGRSLGSLAIAFAGEGAVDRALAARARAAGIRVAPVDAQPLDFVVTTEGAGDAPAPLVDLSAHLDASRRAETVRAMRDRIAAEGLIASLGFGRDGFHPPYLLNPEIACTSCC